MPAMNHTESFAWQHIAETATNRAAFWILGFSSGAESRPSDARSRVRCLQLTRRSAILETEKLVNLGGRDSVVRVAENARSGQLEWRAGEDARHNRQVHRL